MPDNTPTDTPTDNDIHAHAKLWDMPNHGFDDADDAADAKAVLSEDPLASPSPFKWSGSQPTTPLSVSLDTLPPAARPAIAAKLVGLTGERRAAEEARLVAEAMRPLAREARGRMGVGEQASAVHREQAQLAGEIRDLAREFDNLTAELQRVVRHETSTDPDTGDAVAVPVYAVRGAREVAYQQRSAEILSRIDALERTEGKGRLRMAAIAEMAARRGIIARVAERDEAIARAADIAREKRINDRATILARYEENSL